MELTPAGSSPRSSGMNGRIRNGSRAKLLPRATGLGTHVFLVVLLLFFEQGFSVFGELHGPVFVQEPPSHVDFSNSTGARVDCAAHGTPPPDLRWVTGSGAHVTDVAGVRLAFPNGTLAFMAFHAEGYRQDVHAAIYRCVASNAVGAIVSRDVRVRAVVMQMYEVQVYNEFVIRGNTAVLKCHIPSFVTDYVKVTSWIRDSAFNIHSQVETGGRYMIMPTGELHIREVMPNDAYRNYRCRTVHRLTGEAKVSSTAGRLVISDPQGSVSPRITDSKPLVQVHQGETALLPCAAQGHPAPTYSWFVKTNRSQMNPVVVSDRVQHMGGTLVIDKARIGDGNTYVCVVSSPVGNQSAVTVLSVTVPLTAYVQPHKQKVDLSKTAIFTCKVAGFPVLSVIWLKDAQPLPVTPSPPYILRIDSVQRGQNGMYQCVARNDYESAQGTAELRLGDAIPEFQKVFEEQVVHPGSSVSLVCVVSANPSAEVTWMLDDSSLQDMRRFQSSRYVNGHGDVVSHLNISNLRTEDGGEYRCRARNRLGTRDHVARINVHGPVGIRQMSRMSVVAGEAVTAKCRVYGYPIESISWEKDGLLLPVNRRQKVFPNGTLLIQNVQKATDGGKYTCVVRTGAADAIRKEMEVTVMVPPKISPFSFQDEDLYAGMRAQVTCAVRQGDLPIAIQWLKDGRPIEPSRGVTTRVFDGFTSSLSIDSVSSKHNGNYTCVASNMAASISYSTSLQVNVPPRWVIQPQDTQVLVGGNAVMDCQADGYPTPSITWMKAVGEVPSDYREILTNGPDVMVLQNGSLVFMRAREDDQGYYLCQASNNIGEGLSKVFNIDVHVPVRFETAVRNQTAKRGESVRLQCQARGDSPIRLVWSINSHVIDPDVRPRYKIKETALKHGHLSELIVMLTERADSGLYSCTAENAFGRDSTNVHLVVQEPPEPPNSVNIIDYSPRSVQLSWMTPFDGNSPILRYVLQYKHLQASWGEGTTNESVSGSLSMATITNLLPATKYVFRVLAENEVGVSEPSDAVTIATGEEAPSAPPTDIRIEAAQSQSLKIYWKPPQKSLWNGEILGYNVGYRQHDSGEPYLFKAVEGVGERGGELELRPLLRFTKYDVVVQAYNRVGPGPVSEPITATTAEEVPSKPPENVRCSPHSSQSIHVNWSPPPTSSINGVLQGYKVLYKAQQDSTLLLYDSSEKETKITPSLETLLHGLQRFQNYSIQVLAFTRVGDGAKSDVIVCKTLEDVPEAPGDVKAIVNSHESILLSWLPPFEPNGAIVRYTVYIRITDSGKENTTKFVMPSTQLSFEAKGLKKGRRYEFWVTSSTAVGEGQSTKMVAVTPSSKVPARIASFGQRIITPWKTDIQMLCLMVGNPLPERTWTVGGQPLLQSDRFEVNTEGSLWIRSVQLSDSGNYSCWVKNAHGSDVIFYVMLVQAPPVPPHPAVLSTTASSVTVHWKPAADGGSPITGYSLSFKRDYGEWEEVQLETHQRSHVLDNLWCGSRYQLYMSAYNIIGSGEPSDITTVRTRGTAPVAPTRDQLIMADAHSVALNLQAWDDGGCAILYFIVEYKPRTSEDWTLVSNNVKPQRDTFIIPDLEANIAYNLRVTAHNSAGSVVSEYEFTTYSITERSLPPHAGQEDEDDVPFYFDPKLVVPIIIAIIGLVMIFTTYALCVSIRRKKLHERRANGGYPGNEKEGEADNMTHEFDKKCADDRCHYQKQGFNYLIGPPPSRPNFNYQQRGLDEDICPYATYRIPDSSTKIEAHTSSWHEQPLKTSSLQTYNNREKRESSKQCSAPPPEDINNEETKYRYPVTEYSSPTKGSESKPSDKQRSSYYSISPDQRQMAPLNLDTNVPDLLYHGTESSTSNDSSPDNEWGVYESCVRDRRLPPANSRQQILAARMPPPAQFAGVDGRVVDKNRGLYPPEPSAPTLDDEYLEETVNGNILLNRSRGNMDIPLHRLSSGGAV